MFAKSLLSGRIFWRAASSLVVIAMVLTLAAGMVQPAPASASSTSGAKVPIDPYVYINLEREGSARVLVVLKEQADLSLAATLETKEEKGQFVYTQLTEVARRTQAPLQAFLDERGAAYRVYWITNMFMVLVDAQLLDELAAQPGIDHIEFYHQPYPDVFGKDLGPDYGAEFGPPAPADLQASAQDELFNLAEAYGPLAPGEAGTDAVEWNITRVHAPDVWTMGVTGAGAVIGDLDTGVDWTHPALVNQYRPQVPGAPTRHDYNWYDSPAGSAVPLDYDTHGTHTMGTIIGDDGGTNQIGMAPGADWIACPGIGSPYVGPFECFQFFLAPTQLDGSNPRPDLAPDVINNSWSSAGTDFHPAIQALYEAGIFFAKSAGNTGSGCRTITNPGQWPEVTATAAFSQGDTIASFSSRGPVQIGRDLFVKPDVAAPGVNVRSALPGGGYVTNQGTSMAAPHVTGAVALLVSANPALAGRIDILQMLLKTTAETKVSTQCSPFVDHPNDVWGWGILNIQAAVVQAQAIALGTLQGHVYDGSSMAPIAGARLGFTNAAGWTFPDISDNTAAYNHVLPSGTYTVNASFYGYLDAVIPNVVVNSGSTTTQDILLTAAPLWNISGTVSEETSGAPLAASLVLEQTPISTNSSPDSGAYSMNAAQGNWWLAVTSPGHTADARQVTLNQNLVEDFVLTPIQNYYMNRSVDGACGATFNWMDASTGGTEYPLTDDSFATVPLPAGRNFVFYGNTYTNLYLSSNGMVVFGNPTGANKWSGLIPDPAAPNNGIYAISNDLNPAGGSQGHVYAKYVNSRYFVLEWFQVQHYPSGSPETFEIILDLDTGVITIQYLVVTDPSGAVSGVENINGSEATLYAYNDPVLITENVAVEFYPQFSTPPPTGGAGEMFGTVTDAGSSLPIAGATVNATAYTGGEVFTYTTDINGAYTAPLCADWYDVFAVADGYDPSLTVQTSVISGTQTLQDFSLNATCVAISDADFSWVPITPTVGSEVTFTAVVSGSQPASYDWDFGDGSTGTGPVATHTYAGSGGFLVSLTVDNCAATPFTVEHTVTVVPGTWQVFVPIVHKN